MADDDADTFVSEADVRRYISQAEARAQDYLRTAPTCAKCGHLVATRGLRRHTSCEPSSLAGLVCTCPPGCSDTHWTNGRRACDPYCQPCRIMAGKPLRKERR